MIAIILMKTNYSLHYLSFCRLELCGQVVIDKLPSSLADDPHARSVTLIVRSEAGVKYEMGVGSDGHFCHMLKPDTYTLKVGAVAAAAVHQHACRRQCASVSMSVYVFVCLNICSSVCLCLSLCLCSVCSMSPLQVGLSTRQLQAGLSLAGPNKQVDLRDAPVSGVLFSQFRARVTGTVHCLGQSLLTFTYILPPSIYL